MSVNFVQKTKRRPHHYFIPSAFNDYKPHFVRHGALHFYSAALIAVKVSVLVLLFIVYPSPAKFSTVTSNRIIELTNNARAEEGLPVLMHSSVLDQSAMLKAEDMLAKDYFAHDDPIDGTSPWEWFKAAGYNYTFAGENLAMNFSEAEEAIDAWLASPTHRANIMNVNYDEIGIAVVVGQINGHQTTLVVQHFGKSFVSPATSQFARTSAEQVPSIAGTTQVSSGEAIEVTFKNASQKSWTAQLAYYAQKFFWILLIFIAINLMLTIFIRIKIQHKPVILHCLLVIGLALLALLIHPHFLESVVSAPTLIL
jgi:hypothetical protein